MAGDLGEQAIQVEWKAAQITVKTLKALIEQLIMNNKSITYGEQKLSKLNIHQKKLDSVELKGEDMKAFRRELNKYSVDFSVMKNKETGNHTVFFKSQDVERVYSGLKSCVANFSNESVKKKPIKEKMQEAEIRAAQRNAEKKTPEQDKKFDRGKDER